MVRRAAVILLSGTLFAASCASDEPVAAPAPDAAGVPAAPTTDEVFAPATSEAVATTTTTTVPPTTTSTTTTTTTTTSTTTSTTTTTTTLPPVSPSPCPPTGAEIWENRPPSDLPAPEPPADWRTESVGTSVQGRDLTALVRPVDSPERTVLVIGGIHGNEPASPPSVRAMVETPVPDDLELWLLPDLNPDGTAAGTRCNANGVDLNRNFSWRWRPSTGGPGAFSEPESAAARDLVERLDPDLVVWVHQPLDYVSSIGATPDAYEEAWAAGSGLPVRRDVTQHGGGESWTAFVAAVPSMLIEIDTWDATQQIVDEQVAGLAALLQVVVPR